MANEVVVRHHGFPNDDIVTALRTMVQFTNSVAGGVCWRAADEIERLREWKEVANMFGGCFRMDEFGQFPTSNDGDVLEAVKAWERLRTKEARRD